MGCERKKLVSILVNVVFTIVNVLLGILVTVVMVGSGLFHLLLKMEHQEYLSGFDAFFEAYVINPASGVVYLVIVATFVVYQAKVSRQNRLFLNIYPKQLRFRHHCTSYLFQDCVKIPCNRTTITRHFALP
ncbi:hypothetical protein ACFL2V_03470 [Pseudomonadota bacterium]